MRRPANYPGVTDPNGRRISFAAGLAAASRSFALTMSKVVLNGGVGEAVRMAKSNLRNVPRP